MKSTMSLEIKVGLLLVTGLIALIVLILVSDRVDFEHRYTVKAYLPNADGLLVGSPVSLSGIRIGKVSAIRPDISGRNAIQVEMEVLASYDIPSSANLTLATAGILGDAYLAFTVPTGEPGLPLLKDGTASIDGSPGFFSEMSDQARTVMGSVNEVLDEKTRNDLKRFMGSSADTMEESAKLLAGLNERLSRLDGVLDRVDTLLDTGNSTVTNVGQQVSATLGKTNELILEVEGTLKTLRPVAADALSGVQSTLAKIDQAFADPDNGLTEIMANTSGSLRSLADILSELQDGRGFIGQLLRSHSLAQDLNDIAIDLRNAAGVIADEPSVLVWGVDEEESTENRRRRQTLSERRAFMEGYRPGAEANQTPASELESAAQ